MSFSPYRLVSRLVLHPELGALTILDAGLKQAACALLAQHQDIGRTADDSPVTAAASDIIDAAWNLRRLLRRYRVVLARAGRNIPF